MIRIFLVLMSLILTLQASVDEVLYKKIDRFSADNNSPKEVLKKLENLDIKVGLKGIKGKLNLSINEKIINNKSIKSSFELHDIEIWRLLENIAALWGGEVVYYQNSVTISIVEEVVETIHITRNIKSFLDSLNQQSIEKSLWLFFKRFEIPVEIIKVEDEKGYLIIKMSINDKKYLTSLIEIIEAGININIPEPKSSARTMSNSKFHHRLSEINNEQDK